MRRLFPDAADVVDLETAYAVPVEPGRRFVRGNMVASADGAAQARGRTKDLTNETDQHLLGLLRDLSDVVLAGAETVRLESYGPTRPSEERRARRRDHGLAEAAPVAVISRSLAFDPDGRFFAEAAPDARPIVLTCEASPADKREALARVAEVVVAGDELVDLRLGLDALGERGLHRVICEGGPALLAEITAGGLLDELCLVVSPQLRAGPATRILNGPDLADPPALDLLHVLEEDNYLYCRYRVARS